MDCRFNRTQEQATANASHPCHKGTLVCGEELSISFLKKKKLKMHQSWGVGFSILEISKLIMQKLYYDEIIPNLGEGNVSIRVLFRPITFPDPLLTFTMGGGLV